MFGFASSSRVARLEREMLQARTTIKKLEDAISLLHMSIGSLQSAMLAASKTQEAVAYDVARIGELIAALLEASGLDGFSGPDDGESGPSGGETIH